MKFIVSIDCPDMLLSLFNVVCRTCWCLGGFSHWVINPLCVVAACRVSFCVSVSLPFILICMVLSTVDLVLDLDYNCWLIISLLFINGSRRIEDFQIAVIRFDRSEV